MTGPRTPRAALQRGARLRALLRSGILVDVALPGASCAPSCRVTVEMLAAPANRRASAAATRTMVLARGRSNATGTTTRVRVKPTARGRRALRRVRRASVVLRTTVVEPGGRSARAQRRVTLRR